MKPTRAKDLMVKASLERTDNAALAEAICREPGVWEGLGPPEGFDRRRFTMRFNFDAPGNRCYLARIGTLPAGIFFFEQQEAGAYEAHLALRPCLRGAAAVAAGREAIRRIKAEGARRVIAKAPRREVGMYAAACGGSRISQQSSKEERIYEFV